MKTKAIKENELSDFIQLLNMDSFISDYEFMCQVYNSNLEFNTGKKKKK